MHVHRFAILSLWGVIALALTLGSCIPPGQLRPRGAGDSLHTNITRVLDLRIHGAGNPASPPILRIPIEGKPPTGLGNDALTIDFEMQSEALPNITLVLVHCDKDWVPTENMFVQDPVRLKSSDFEIQRSPLGVQHYDYMVSITFPQSGNRLQVLHSGNYLARIVDYYDNKRVIAEGRFFVVEPRAAVDVGVYSDFYESAQTKVLQHGLKIRVDAEPSFDVFGGQINGIHVYPSGAWYTPFIADEFHNAERLEKGEAWARFLPSFAGKNIAEFGNIPAGNEHRLLDLTDLVQYPTTGAILTTPLSDIPRQDFGLYDNNGMTPERFIPFSDADYVYFEFRLDLRGSRVKEDIFVVGTFNNWLPSREWQLHYDTTSGFYIARGLVRRAFHEYQYVAGNWDADLEVLRGADPSLLEGNVTAASLPYYALVYYHETSGGSYDRIIGAGVDISGLGR